MTIDLYPHNQVAYENLVAQLDEFGKSCILQPTGLGKTFVAARYIQEHPGSKVLWLCNSGYIFETQGENLKKADPDFDLSQIEFMTYHKALSDAKRNRPVPSADILVLDEFHHVGAEEWSKGVARIVEANPQAKLIGMSATCIRYGDNMRDMSEELFEGHAAARMSLSDAWTQGLLPIPVYVSALYETPAGVIELKDLIDSMEDGPERDEAYREYEALRRNIESADKLEDVFPRHLGKSAKLIVFCSGVEHLEHLVSLHREWFGKVSDKVSVYKTYNGYGGGSAEFEAFKANDSDDELKVLYCISQLNEGVHVKGIDAVVLARPTGSPTIYEQQVGRALEAGSNKVSIIFDLVNNLGSTSFTRVFADAIRELSEKKALEKDPDNTAERDAGDDAPVSDFAIHDQLEDIRAMYERINEMIRPKPMSTDEKIAFLEALAADGLL